MQLCTKQFDEQLTEVDYSGRFCVIFMKVDGDVFWGCLRMTSHSTLVESIDQVSECSLVDVNDLCGKRDDYDDVCYSNES